MLPICYEHCRVLPSLIEYLTFESIYEMLKLASSCTDHNHGKADRNKRQLPEFYTFLKIAFVCLNQVVFNSLEIIELSGRSRIIGKTII